MKKREIDLEEFMADVCDVVGGMGIWPSFLRHMKEEKGYEEKEIDKAFEEIQKQVGRV